MTKFYYVTAIRGKRVAWLFGPCLEHAAALMFVEPARKLACAVDPWCDFDAFGTTSIETNDPKPANIFARYGNSL